MSEANRSDLPLPDYDGLPLGELQHRVRALDATELRTLLAYEQDHGQRTAVVELLTARLEQLASGAEPTGADPAAPRPQAPPRRAGSPVSPATSTEPIHPPPHGTPEQHGKPKGNRAV
ncbi:hypothetical protein [Streptomyces buecherae]|uniref:hypothetical protein n=1 Tax=Streptomyces buecherae TaxID=2763006 RepID=UPI0036B2D0A0